VPMNAFGCKKQQSLPGFQNSFITLDTVNNNQPQSVVQHSNEPQIVTLSLNGFK
jgi:hypothetical protein